MPWYSPSHQRTQIPLPKPSISTSFPDLPLELRLHIWQLTLPRPRVVHLNHQAFTQSNNISHSETNPGRLYFLTCKKFSQVFSSNYTKILVAQTDGSSNHRRVAFVDYRRDTISLCLDSFQAFAVDKTCLDISRIHNLALAYCTALASYQECIWTVLERLCPELNTFHLVLGDIDELLHMRKLARWRSLQLIPIDKELQFTEGDTTWKESYEDLRLKAFRAWRTKERIRNDTCENSHWWSSVELNVSLLCHSPPEVYWWMQKIWLKPKLVLPYYVAFYTERPVFTNGQSLARVLGFGTSRSSQFWIRQSAKGQLFSWYDGIERLFDEGLQRLDTTAEEEWFKYGKLHGCYY